MSPHHPLRFPCVFSTRYPLVVHPCGLAYASYIPDWRACNDQFVTAPHLTFAPCSTTPHRTAPHPLFGDRMASEKKLRSMFPPGVAIKDFGYPPLHALHTGPSRLCYDGDTVHDDPLGSDSDSDAAPGDPVHTAQPALPDHHLPRTGSDARTSDEINRQAIALFSFAPENDNEVALTEGQVIWISYRHGQGWLVAEDPQLGEIGLVPEEYVEICYDRDEIIEDIPRPFLPLILNGFEKNDDDDWEDTDFDEGEEAELARGVDKLLVDE